MSTENEEFVPDWQSDCGGDLDSTVSLLRICLFTSPGKGLASAYLYSGNEALSEEHFDVTSQAEAQVWCQNKARKWLKQIKEALRNNGLIK